MSTGTITEAKLAPEEDRHADFGNGPLHRWKVLIDSEGKTINTAILRQVRDGESKDPTGLPAETYTNRKGNLGWRVAQAQGGRGASGGGGKSPEEQKRIQRQHSQEMALRAITLMRGAQAEPIKDFDGFRQALKGWTDWWEADIG